VRSFEITFISTVQRLVVSAVSQEDRRMVRLNTSYHRVAVVMQMSRSKTFYVVVKGVMMLLILILQ
jgi:hypothetical protein